MQGKLRKQERQDYYSGSLALGHMLGSETWAKERAGFLKSCNSDMPNAVQRLPPDTFFHVEFPIDLLPVLLPCLFDPKFAFQNLSQFSQFHGTAFIHFTFPLPSPPLSLFALWLSGFPITQLAAGFTMSHYTVNPGVCFQCMSGQQLTPVLKPLAGPRAGSPESAEWV